MVAAMASIASAQAADTVVTSTGTVTVDASAHGHDVIASVQDNSGDVTTTISFTNGGIGQQVTPITTSSIAVDGNDIHGSAIGNSFTNSISPFDGIGNDVDGDGAAALGFQMNRNGTILANILTNSISVDLDDFANGTVSASSNSIRADATGNLGTSLLAGEIPNSYISATQGASALSFGNGAGSDLLNAQGSLVASTIQVSRAEVTARADQSAITLDLVSTGDNTVTAAPALNGNLVDASAQSNRSTSTIEIQAGGAPDFTGSVVLTNGQGNIRDVTMRNTDTSIIATIAADGPGEANILNGSLSVDGNIISGNATGNRSLGDGVAGNRIILGDDMSFNGADTSNPGTDLVYVNPVMSGSVAADIIVNSSQSNIGRTTSNRMAVDARIADASVAAGVQAINAGAVSVSGNSINSTASGNAASSSFATGQDTPLFSGSLALANQQGNLFTDISAVNTNWDIAARVADADQQELARSTVTLDGNTVSAATYGNQASQQASLEAAVLNFPLDTVTLTGGTIDGNANADGSATITNLQAIYRSDVTAGQDGQIHIGTAAQGSLGSALALTDNVQEAIALGNSGSNGLALSGTGLATGAGIASVQIVGFETNVTAHSASYAFISTKNIEAGSAEVSGNLQRAIAYGASVGNTLAIDGTVLTVGGGIDDTSSTVTYTPSATNGFVLDAGDAPLVQAAYGVLNDQSISTNVSAIADHVAAFRITVGSVDEHLYMGSATNDGNAVVAAAYGTNAANRASLDVGSLTTADSDFASVLNLTNAQTVSGALDNVIYAEVSGGDYVVLTHVEMQLVGSSLSTSDNVLQALAQGNLADNRVAVGGTGIDTAADALARGSASVLGNVTSTDTSFTLNNVQASDGTIIATLRTPDDTAKILTRVGDFVLASSIANDGNSLSAAATGNRADNLMTLDATTLATSSAVTNYQNSQADITAQIGIAGGSSYNEGGVRIFLGADAIENSNFTIDRNSTAGSVTGNVAANSLEISGNSVAPGSAHTISTAELAAQSVADNSQTLADHNLLSRQISGPANLTSEVFGTYGIDTRSDGDIGAVTMSVSGNSQSSRAVSNTAANSVDIAATNLSAGSALASVQTSDAAVGATSDLDIYTPGAMTSSSRNLSDNTNLAAATINIVSNRVTVRATNLDPASGTAGNARLINAETSPLDSTFAIADHVLANWQEATTSVTATAVTNIFNDDGAGLQFDSIDLSSANITGNSTIAEATANRALNALSAEGLASMAGSAGVFNGQISTAVVAASATTDAGVALNGNDPVVATLVLSSVTLGENGTAALARGNVAINALDLSSGGNYGPQSGTTATVALDSTALGASEVAARGAVLNLQSNNGAISASSTAASYMIAFDNTGDPSIVESSASVTGNSLSAGAYGNTATNSIALVSLNTGMPTAAIGSRQQNTASVTASVTTVAFGISSGRGEVADSSLMVTGNSVATTAIGNSSASAILAGH
ncbi:MAG TPA: hypothetical protein VL094_07730 [Sphingomonadaceae bacterium]|nr:hypothetical protein [Sphingomonadaceae bacterium]